MKVTDKVKQILQYYDSDNAGSKAKLCQILMHGRLSGTGKMMILPVDQGFEHGPVKSFAQNPDAYDPEYHFKLAINGEFNAFAAPIGLLESGANKFAGQIPMILKLNNNNSLTAKSVEPDQTVTASVKDALRLGCVAVGLTIYPGSSKTLDMIEEAKDIIKEAKSLGLAVMVWSYPRGGDLSTAGETAIDICAYAAHIASMLGAHIIKVKPPTDHIENDDLLKLYQSIPIDNLQNRIKHIMQACFNGKKLVVFSGGNAKNRVDLISDIRAINAGGANGSIIGRNSFQRPYDESISLLNDIYSVYDDRY